MKSKQKNFYPKLKHLKMLSDLRAILQTSSDSSTVTKSLELLHATLIKKKMKNDIRKL